MGWTISVLVVVFLLRNSFGFGLRLQFGLCEWGWDWVFRVRGEYADAHDGNVCGWWDDDGW